MLENLIPGIIFFETGEKKFWDRMLGQKLKSFDEENYGNP